jgi:hypothetical protein
MGSKASHLILGLGVAAAALVFCLALRAQNRRGDPNVVDTIRLADGKFRVELRFKAEGAQAAILTATMKTADGKVLWQRDVNGDDPSISPNDPATGLIGDEGRFFIFHRFRYFYNGWALVTPTSETHLTPRDWDRPSYFVSGEPSLIHLTRVNDEPVVAVWDRDLEAWTAFSARDGREIKATTDLVARWNEEAREEVLTKVGRFPGNVSIDRIFRPKLDELREIDLEFLAIRRDPRDRVVFERILGAEAERYEGFFDHLMVHRAVGGGARTSMHLGSTSQARIGATRLLAVFDGTAKKDSSLSRSQMRKGLSSSSADYEDTEVRPNLGEIYGLVELSTPVRKPAGVIRIHLIPGEDERGWETRSGRETVSFTPQAGSSGAITDRASFSFTTALPGKYFLKAVWDRRGPLTDTNHAGPGDYESALVGPIDLRGGEVVTNVVLNCTNRAPLGEDYYRADEAALRLWESGEMTASSMASMESFTAPAGKWILRTNSAAAGRLGWISSIGLRKDFPCKPYQSPLPGGLMVYARDRSRAGKNELRELEIRDEHGCRFESTVTDDGSPMMQFYFAAFPRSDAAWTLVGFDGSTNALFDYSITNLVRVPARAIEAKPLPLEVVAGPVQLQITNVSWRFVERWEAGLWCTIPQNVGTNKTWITMDERFLDRHGNAMCPTNFCREEKSVRVTGKVLKRQNLRGANPMSIDFSKIPECYSFEFAAPREAVKFTDF